MTSATSQVTNPQALYQEIQTLYNNYEVLNQEIEELDLPSEKKFDTEIYNRNTKIIDYFNQLMTLQDRTKQTFANCPPSQNSEDAYTLLHETHNFAKAINACLCDSLEHICHRMQDKCVTKIQEATVHFNDYETKKYNHSFDEISDILSKLPQEKTLAVIERIIPCLKETLDTLQSQEVLQSHDENDTQSCLSDIEKKFSELESHAKKVISGDSNIQLSSQFRGFIDEIYSNLYSIHTHESPNTVTNHLEYGKYAFFGLNGLTASNEDRIRAVQRTTVFYALEVLSMGIRDKNPAMIANGLNLLESEGRLHPNDMPTTEKSNIAHLLFEELYKYCSLDSTRKFIEINPQNDCFQGDFGRFGWHEEKVSKAIKQIVLGSFFDQLKTTWVPQKNIPSNS